MALDRLTNAPVERRTGSLDILTTPHPFVRAIGRFLISKEASKAPKTVEYYRFWLVRFLRYCMEHNISEPSAVTPEVLHVYFRDLRDTHAKASQNGCYRALKTFFKWLVEEEEIRKSPMLRVEKPRLEEKAVKPYSMDDIRTLLAGFRGHSKYIGLRMQAMILVMLDTGLRRGELVGLKVGDLAWSEDKNLYVTVRHTKTGVERHVRLGTGATQAVLRYLDVRKSEREELWLSEERTPIQGNGVYLSIHRECQRLGIVIPRTCHAFRNTSAINCLTNGMGEIALQAMLGHKTQAMTRHYVKATEEVNMLRAHRSASPVDNMKL